MNYIIPQDIVIRLLRIKPYWYHGRPDIELIGDNNSFGTLRFDFHDSLVEYRIYIKDRESILDVVHLAIFNFEDLSQELLR